MNAQQDPDDDDRTSQLEDDLRDCLWGSDDDDSDTSDSSDDDNGD